MSKRGRHLHLKDTSAYWFYPLRNGVECRVLLVGLGSYAKGHDCYNLYHKTEEFQELGIDGGEVFDSLNDTYTQFTEADVKRLVMALN